MRIDIKEIQNILYNCNVNVYDMYIDTELDNIDILLHESIENIGVEELIQRLEEIFNEVDLNQYDADDVHLYLSYWEEIY